MIYHLVRSRNKEVRLHESSPLGDMTLECYVTGATNVFNLGFVPCKDENVVVLVTREAAQSNPATLKELNLDLALWEPLIQDKVFLPWLLQMPDKKEIDRARPVNPGKVIKLEELWKTNPEATLDDVENDDGDGEVRPVALTYEDAHLYQGVFGPLIQLEADYDKAQRESQTKDDVTVRWDIGLNKRRIAYFSFGADENAGVSDVGRFFAVATADTDKERTAKLARTRRRDQVHRTRGSRGGNVRHGCPRGIHQWLQCRLFVERDEL